MDVCAKRTHKHGIEGKNLMWGHGDLEVWKPDSTEFIPDSKWMFVQTGGQTTWTHAFCGQPLHTESVNVTWVWILLLFFYFFYFHILIFTLSWPLVKIRILKKKRTAGEMRSPFPPKVWQKNSSWKPHTPTDSRLKETHTKNPHSVWDKYIHRKCLPLSLPLSLWTLLMAVCCWAAASRGFPLAELSLSHALWLGGQTRPPLLLLLFSHCYFTVPSSSICWSVCD